MNASKIKRFFENRYFENKDWTTNRKLVVIESDDWGNNRIPNSVAKLGLESAFGRFPQWAFENYDSLLTGCDLRALFKTLENHKSRSGKNPIITANTIMANPDFQKIRKSNFEEYHFEIFTKTLENSSQHHGVFDFWKLGIERELLCPQLHGREHINVSKWLSLLRRGNRELKVAFDYNVFGLGKYLIPGLQGSILAAFDYNNENELEFSKSAIIEGCAIFEKIFGYKSETFIAPNYILGDELLQTLKRSGVNGIQGLRRQIQPKYRSGDSGNCKSRVHFLGSKNCHGQRFLIRNVFFEPFEASNKKLVVEACLKQVRKAFYKKRPAIISTHRLNFSGNLSKENRNKNLEALDELLRKIIQIWPEVEFLTSPQLLGEIK